MGIHPLRGKDNIDIAYRDYLASSFPINDEVIEEAFLNELMKENLLSKGPYLEVTAPYKKGSSIAELVTEGELSPLFMKVNQEELPFDRALYTHQERSIRKANKNKNFVVATGTGSGKTESFMLPILNSLFKEVENQTLTPGIRALFVYPMNALANDQMKRLRSLLKDTPEITFGRYTGETEQFEKNALNKYKHQNPNVDRIPNELLSRKEMRDNPPHILVTNYAMLEYLLLRPSDTSFFDGPYSNEWRFIVLDEAHSYNGANGIEIGMLLRRLKDRVLKDRPFRGSLQCIATSATLGTGEDVKKKVLKFAEEIFDEPFNYINEQQNDLIESERIDYEKEHKVKFTPKWAIYKSFQNLIDNDEILDSDISDLIQFNLTEEHITEIYTYSRKPERFLYEFLSRDQNIFDLRDLLKDKPKTLKDILSQLVVKQIKNNQSQVEDLQQGVVNLVNLAVIAKALETEEPLLPARYHVFVRAIEGCYLRLFPTKKVSLQTKKFDEVTGNPFHEIGVCSSCGQIHLIGDIEEGKLIQRNLSNIQDTNINYSTFMLVKEENVNFQDDEDEEAEESKQDNKELYEMCPCCSSIWPKGYSDYCCEEREKFSVQTILVIKEDMKVKGYSKCNYCGKSKSNPIRLFLTGQDGPASVLSTSLYQQLIKDSKRVIKNNNITTKGSLGIFDGLFEETEVSIEHEIQYEPQKLLVFSDSRQEAAYFAPYLEYTYEQILWRSIILKATDKFDDQDGVSLKTLANEVYNMASDLKIFPDKSDKEERKSIVDEVIMAEFVKGYERVSLEGTGLISLELKLPEKMEKVSDQMAEKLGLKNGMELQSLINILFNTLRFQNAVTHLERSTNRADRMKPINYETGINKEGRDAATYTSSWLPKRSNIRLNFLKKVFINKGYIQEEAAEKAREVLSHIWDLTNSPQFFNDFYKSRSGNNLVLQDPWRILKNKSIFECTSCKTISSNNVENTCPINSCNGRIKEKKKEDLKSHYIRLYRETIPVKMSVKEHTAQISPEKASEYQEKFVNGEINVLSCSTTFEMGVDVGGLEAVFLRNVPPETSNYIQRAGRAGRRKSTVAFVLTFAQRRSHDLNYFNEPENIIAGVIKPPVLKMDNPKIMKRHLNSLVMSYFFRKNEALFGTVSDFFLDSLNVKSGPKQLDKFIKEMPANLSKSIEKMLPQNSEIRKHPELLNWEKDLELEKDSLMNKLSTRYYEDLKELTLLKDDEFRKGSKGVDKITRVIDRILKENLISFFSSGNILPKYGFPIDVVEMSIFSSEGSDLRLSRDLSIAIAEYAPSSQIVANGNIYESTGIKKIKGFEVPTLFYTECSNCKSYKVIERLNPNYSEQKATCENCQTSNPVHKLIIPKFGFTAIRKEKAGERKPSRENRSRIFFSEYFYSDEAEIKDKQLEVESDKVLSLKGNTIRVKYSPFGKLSVISKGRSGQGYKICSSCGSMVFDKDNKHKNMMNRSCDGKVEYRAVHLGHEFISDVLEIEFENSSAQTGVWESVLYSILNGISMSLGINRRDIDGCIRYSNKATPTIILFDKVPGGAGYMQEVFGRIPIILSAAQKLVSNCQCGKETSCYGCLKDYSNQYCHDTLSRGEVEKFLVSYL